jgi:hypothetical protein
MISEFKKSVFAYNSEGVEFEFDVQFFRYDYFDRKILNLDHQEVEFKSEVGSFKNFFERQEKIFDRILIGYKKAKKI